MPSIFRFITYLYSWIYTSYILHKNLSNCFILKRKITLFYFLSFVFHSLYHSLSFTVTHCHFLSLVVIFCHSFSFVLPLVATRCHSLFHSLSLVATRCFIRCHSFYHSLPVIRCHSLLLDVRLVCLFINDPMWGAFILNLEKQGESFYIFSRF